LIHPLLIKWLAAIIGLFLQIYLAHLYIVSGKGRYITSPFHTEFSRGFASKIHYFGNDLLDFVNYPVFRYPPHQRIFELLRVGLRVAQVTVLVQATGEEVVQQPRLDRPLFGDEPLRLPDGLDCCVQTLGDAALLRSDRHKYFECVGVVTIQARHASRRI